MIWGVEMRSVHSGMQACMVLRGCGRVNDHGWFPPFLRFCYPRTYPLGPRIPTFLPLSCVCVSTIFDVGFRVGWGGGKRLTVASPWCFLLVFFLSHPSFRIWIPRGLVSWFPCFPRSVPGSCLLFLPFPSPRHSVPTGRWERKRGGKPGRGGGERATPHRIAFLPLRGLSVSCSCGARHLFTRTREAVGVGSWCDLGFFGNLSHLGCTSFLRFFGGGPDDRAHTHRRTVSRTPPTSRCRARATSRPLWKVEERHTKRGRKREVVTEGEKDR
eukprot:scaffold2142_cov327-Pavlova_lutheri.AAC.2